MAPELLNERPRQTAIDFLVEGEDAVICIEAKWTEAGFGGCSCEGDPLKRQCKAAMDDRVLYWDAAAQEMNLPARFATEVCPISVSYQAVRNVAAAKALAGDDRIPVFALLYDDRNPYFSGAGDWPGWSAVLDDAINEKGQGRVRFASATWQSLAKNLSAAAAVSEWARDKHQLDT